MTVAEVDIPKIKSEFIAHSQIKLPSDKGADMFDFSFIKPQTEQQFKSYMSINGYLRNVDSEAKILEDIASKIINNNIQGTIDLYTEKTCCPSCWNIIQEFKEMYPNIILNVYDS